MKKKTKKWQVKSRMSFEEQERRQKAKLPKTATFAGRQYHLLFGELDGNCDTDDKYWLVVGRDLSKRVGLETAIHEALHACRWTAREKTVDQDARDLARFLWSLGYRKI